MDHNLLSQHFQILISGQAIEAVLYSYTEHTRKKVTRHLEPKKVIFLEGILFADRYSPVLGNKLLDLLPYSVGHYAPHEARCE